MTDKTSEGPAVEKAIEFMRGAFRYKLVAQAYAELAGPRDADETDIIRALHANPGLRARVLEAVPGYLDLDGRTHLEEAAELLKRRPTIIDGVLDLYDWMDEVDEWKKRDQSHTPAEAPSAEEPAPVAEAEGRVTHEETADNKHGKDIFGDAWLLARGITDLPELKPRHQALREAAHRVLFDGPPSERRAERERLDREAVELRKELDALRELNQQNAEVAGRTSDSLRSALTEAQAKPAQQADQKPADYCLDCRSTEPAVRYLSCDNPWHVDKPCHCWPYNSKGEFEHDSSCPSAEKPAQAEQKEPADHKTLSRKGHCLECGRNCNCGRERTEAHDPPCPLSEPCVAEQPATSNPAGERGDFRVGQRVRFWMGRGTVDAKPASAGRTWVRLTESGALTCPETRLLEPDYEADPAQPQPQGDGVTRAELRSQFIDAFCASEHMWVQGKTHEALGRLSTAVARLAQSVGIGVTEKP